MPPRPRMSLSAESPRRARYESQLPQTNPRAESPRRARGRCLRKSKISGMTRELRSLEPSGIFSLSAQPAHGKAVRFEAQAPRTARIVPRSGDHASASAPHGSAVRHRGASASHASPFQSTRPAPAQHRNRTADSHVPPQPIALLVPALLIPRTTPSRHGGRDSARHGGCFGRRYRGRTGALALLVRGTDRTTFLSPAR